jgi:hypothetical protein
MSERWAYRILAIVTLAMGLALFAWGILMETQGVSRTDVESTFMHKVLGVGAFLIGFGGSVNFVRWPFAVLIGVASPLAAFLLATFAFWFVVFLNAVFDLGL